MSGLPEHESLFVPLRGYIYLISVMIFQSLSRMHDLEHGYISSLVVLAAKSAINFMVFMEFMAFGQKHHMWVKIPPKKRMVLGG